MNLGGTQGTPGRAYHRFWANAIDNLILGLPTSIVGLGLVFLSTDISQIDSQTVTNLQSNIFFIVFFYVIYLAYAVYLVGHKGATWGKDAYGLQVVMYKTQSSVPYLKAFIREVIKQGIMIIPMAGSLLYLGNGIVIIFSPEKRGLHDIAAGTQVLKVKDAWSLPKQLLIFGGIIVGYVLVFIGTYVVLSNAR